MGWRRNQGLSLTAHGASATTADLKNLYSAIDYLKETSPCGILLQDIPINEKTVVIGYADASWANARRSGNQIGALVALTTSKVLAEPEKASVIDWKSARSSRVCRSTLETDASAGDELPTSMPSSPSWCTRFHVWETDFPTSSAQMQNHCMTASSMRAPAWPTSALWFQYERFRNLWILLRFIGSPQGSNLQMA